MVYQKRRPVHTHRLAHDETLIGRYDPIGGSEPELDLTPFDTVGASSRKHAYIYRQNNQFYLYPISNAGTQVGDEWVQLGQKRLLVDGDVIVLSMKVAIRFHTGDAT